MKFETNSHLRGYLVQAGRVSDLAFSSFTLDDAEFEKHLRQVKSQHPYLNAAECQARAAFRCIAAPKSKSEPPPKVKKKLGVKFWLIIFGIIAAGLLAGILAHAEPTPQNYRAYRAALKGFSLYAVPQQPNGIILQFRDEGTTLATRNAGLVAFNCVGSGISCAFSGTTFTLTAAGGGAGTGCTTSGSNNQVITDDGAGGCVSEPNLTFDGSTLSISTNPVVPCTNTGTAEQVSIANGDGTCTYADPHVSGVVDHDAVGTTTKPVLMGGYASAAAPADVSADGDATRAWVLRNGAQATVLTAAGALIGGDAANGLDVDVTRVSGNIAVTKADGADVTLGAKADAKSTATDTTAVTAMQVLKEISAMEQAPASRAVTNAGTFAVQAAATEADGANVTLGAKADAKSTATDTTAVTAMQVLKEISAMEQAPASRAVTNAGTFATQSAITAASGSIASGAIASGAIASGAIASGAVASGAYASGSISDGAEVTIGTKADAKSTATDTTAVSVVSVLKEISAMAQVPAALPANQSVNLAQVAGTNTVNGGVAGSQSIGGTVATNVAITANPINLGAQAVSSENSAVTTARQVQLVADLVGKLIVLPYSNPENFVSGVTAAVTDTTSTSTIASAGGSLRNYVTAWSCTNSHATVGTFIKLLDGATIIDEIYAAAAGGGFTKTYPTPLRGTAATAVNSQAVTTGSNFICSASGYKGL